MHIAVERVLELAKLHAKLISVWFTDIRNVVQIDYTVYVKKLYEYNIWDSVKVEKSTCRLLWTKGLHETISTSDAE